MPSPSGRTNGLKRMRRRQDPSASRGCAGAREKRLTPLARVYRRAWPGTAETVWSASALDAGADDRVASVVVTLTRIVALTRFVASPVIYAGVRWRRTVASRCHFDPSAVSPT